MKLHIVYLSVFNSLSLYGNFCQRYGQGNSVSSSPVPVLSSQSVPPLPSLSSIHSLFGLLQLCSLLFSLSVTQFLTCQIFLSIFLTLIPFKLLLLTSLLILCYCCNDSRLPFVFNTSCFQMHAAMLQWLVCLATN